MPNKPILNIANKDTLFNHLMNKKFVIPEYQRFYEWDDGLIMQFLEDIEIAIQQKNNLFVGVFIFREEKNNFCVIDGQQRIITFLIFLRALYNTMKLKANEQDLLNRFLMGISLGVTSVFTLNEKNRRKFFDQFILKGEATLESFKFKKEIIERVAQCKKIFDTSLDKKKKVEIRKIYDFVMNQLEITFINLTKEADESDIFESINAKKLILNDVDLLKNYFLSTAKRQKKLNEAIKQWDKLYTLFNDSSKIINFLEVYSNVKYDWNKIKTAPYTDYKLYHKIKCAIRGSNNHLSILKDMYNCAKDYLKIINPQIKDWPNNRLGKDIYYSLQYLSYLRFETPYPLILKVIRDVKPGNQYLKELIKLCEIVSFVRIVVKQQYPQEVKNYYNEMLLKLISKANKKQLKRVFSELKLEVKGMYNDVEVTNSLKSIRFSKRRYITYFLYRIMLAKSITSFKPGDIKSYKDKSLEHIMPQTLDKTWKKEIKKLVSKDVHVKELFYKEFSTVVKMPQKIGIYHQYFLNLIGNCALLSKADNSETGNRSFKEKKKIYQQKELSNPLFKEVINKGSWDHSTIDSRSKELIQDYFGIFI